MSLEKKNSESVFRIKNMVCPRCIEAVEHVFSSMGKSVSVTLGHAVTVTPMTLEEKELVANKLKEKGFELLEDGKSALISQIKTKIVELVHHRDNEMNENLSTQLSKALNQDYASLSRLFSAVEGVTIERYFTKQKVEKVKELLFYGEMTLSEISFQMGYSSVAYLSAQFKKETGLTPREFKSSGKAKRKGLDEI
ncbi:helix-turn-helix domain-containing protein [Algoriphagus aquatilis]|uniref:Helix-turn-helix domain-containing protein n=1 Tax=Algoriphagus aquatilis TaxID=490186 RepID=A0ABW0BSE2_9BACT